MYGLSTLKECFQLPGYWEGCNFVGCHDSRNTLQYFSPKIMGTTIQHIIKNKHCLYCYFLQNK